MYYSRQTLYNKETHELAALHPSDRDASFNWEVGKNTCFINERGEIFYDNINNWTNFEDFFGRPASYTGEKSDSPYVDTTLKKYLVSDEERIKAYEIESREWFERVLEQIDKDDYVSNPFADGSMCWAMFEYFKEKSGAYEVYIRLSGPKYMKNPLRFSRNGKTYLLGHDEIVLISIQGDL